MSAPFSVITPALGLSSGASFGLGFIRPLTFAPAVVGAAMAYRFDGAEMVRPLSVVAQLTTSAVVANRGLALTMVDDDGNTVYRIPQTTAVVASTTVTAQWLLGMTVPYAGTNGDLIAGLPSMLLSGGYTLSLSASLLDAGDQLKNGRLYLEAYPLGPAGYPGGTTRLYAEGT